MKLKVKDMNQEQLRAYWRKQSRKKRARARTTMKHTRQKIKPADVIKKIDAAKEHKNEIKAELTTLESLVEDLTNAARRDEMKGGGDPLDLEVVEAEYALAGARFKAQLGLLKRLVCA